MTDEKILQKKNFRQISDAITDKYKNFVLENINDHCLRMAVVQGEYPWHYHKYTDEVFLILEGELKIEFKNQPPVFLKPGEFLKIEAGMIHKTSSKMRSVNLTIEKSAEDTVFVDEVTT